MNLTLLAALAASTLGTSGAFDQQGRLWVAQAGDNGIVLQSSMDEGRSWTPPRQVLPKPETVEANGEARPKIAFGPQGQLYLLSNEGANLSYEREFGKIIGNLDVLSKVIADKENRTVVKVVQSLATAVFLPIK